MAKPARGFRFWTTSRQTPGLGLELLPVIAQKRRGDPKKTKFSEARGVQTGKRAGPTIYRKLGSGDPRRDRIPPCRVPWAGSRSREP